MVGFVEPMKAVSGTLPTDDGWAYEIKWDGMRVLAAVEVGDVTAWSGRGAVVSQRFPELGALPRAVGGRTVLLDGEVVVLDEAGRSDFSRMQSRMHVENAARIELIRRENPVHYVVFDLLHLDGHDVLDLPYLDRRSLLLDLVEPGPNLLVPEHTVGDGQALYDAATANHLEGLMAKRIDSTYQPGRRSQAWRKCKVRPRQEVVIGGWATGEGRRAGTVGSLLVGVHDRDAPGNPLRFAGGVGTGFTEQVLADLSARLAELATDTCPFEPRPPRIAGRTMHWVEPILVAEVEFGDWTPDDRLRHPSYLGLRDDKDPEAVIREPLGAAG